jgi:hypothetical protein
LRKSPTLADTQGLRWPARLSLLLARQSGAFQHIANIRPESFKDLSSFLLPFSVVHTSYPFFILFADPVSPVIIIWFSQIPRLCA